MFSFFTKKDEKPVQILACTYEAPTKFNRKAEFDKAVLRTMEDQLAKDIYFELLCVMLGKDVVDRSIAATKFKSDNYAALDKMTSLEYRTAVRAAVGGDFNVNWDSYDQIRTLARSLAKKELE